MPAGILTLTTASPMDMVDITAMVQSVIDGEQIQSGFCFLYNPHTTAGLTINEGADPDVQTDIIAALERMVPRDIAYRHREGNSRSHVMASLLGASVTVAIADGRLQLGTWQRIFFTECDGPRSRKVHWHLDRQLRA